MSVDGLDSFLKPPCQFFPERKRRRSARPPRRQVSSEEKACLFVGTFRGKKVGSSGLFRDTGPASRFPSGLAFFTVRLVSLPEGRSLRRIFFFSGESSSLVSVCLLTPAKERWVFSTPNTNRARRSAFPSSSPSDENEWTPLRSHAFPGKKDPFFGLRRGKPPVFL